MHDSFPLIDKLDHDILMHKDAHFSGNFSLMIDYYEKDGKGVIEEFDLDRIQQLSEAEKQSGQFISEEILSDEEKEEVLKAKAKYASLRNAYDLPEPLAHKIADLVFSEDFDAEKEIEAVLEHGAPAIPLLLQLVKDDDFYHPLFPGYGFAPLYAIECLGKLKAKEAIIPLFESLSKTEFFGEEAVLSALFHIGEPAKEFLLNVVKKVPISKDNENAAIALLLFKDDPNVLSTCLDLLPKEEIVAKPILFTYLLLFCDELKTEEEQKKLRDLKDLPNLSLESREELEWILKAYNKKH